MNRINPKDRLNQSKEGSVLIIAIGFTVILSLFVIPTFLNLSNATLKESNRAYYNMAGINLAEAGVEHGVQALIEAGNGNPLWNGWSIDADTARISLDDFTFVGGIIGTINICILNFESEAPEVVVKSVIPLPHGSPVIKYMYADFSAASSRGLFAYGMLTREFIKASGGVAFNSWESDPDSDPDTPFIPYSDRVSRDKAGIATAGTSDGAIDLGSSDVYGTAAIGSASQSGLNVGWGGQVGPADASDWDDYDTVDLWKKNGWKVSTKTGALTTNFTATFDEVVAPDVISTETWSQYELPYTDKQEKSNKWSTWYENVYVDEATIGAPGEVTILELNELVVKAGATLTIEGDVTIILPRENATTLQVIQGGAIQMDNDANLLIYIAGDIEVTGAGIFSEVAPKQLQLWGTATESQNIDFLNNGQFSGIIYAPNADVKITGNSDLYGSIISNNVTLTGSGSFRFDESLKNYTGSDSSSGPARVTYVEELVGDEREPYISMLDF